MKFDDELEEIMLVFLIVTFDEVTVEFDYHTPMLAKMKSMRNILD